MIHIMQEHHVLTVYEEIIPRLKSHRAAVKYKDHIQYCVARPFNDIDEALRIYNILNSLKHPNLLCPLGLWTCCGDGLTLDDMARAEKDESGELVIANEAKHTEKVIADDVKHAEEVKIKAFITFPAFDGALVDLPREETFLVEDNKSPQVNAYGFTSQGSKLFCDIVDVVKYINGQYGNVNIGPSLPLSPIKINPGRIVYKKVADGKYHVYVWADFFVDLPMHKRKKTSSGKPRDPTIGDVQLANWNSVGTYLKSLCQGCKVTENEELKQLRTVLNCTRRPLLYNDLMWESGLWTVDTKIHFIREVYWCVDNQTERETILKSKSSLELKSFITSLGLTDKETNLFDSIMFLRKKIVAHKDSLYSYSGAKDEMSRHKKEIEIKLQKSKPNYMVNLVKQMRLLNWIPTSPLLRSAEQTRSISWLNPEGSKCILLEHVSKL